MTDSNKTVRPDRLDTNSRHILWIFAVGDKSYYRRDINERVGKIGLRGASGRPISAKEVSEIIGNLEKRKLLTGDSYSSLRIDGNIQDLAVQDAVRQGSLKLIEKAVKDERFAWHSERLPRRDLRIAFYHGDADAFLGGLSQLKPSHDPLRVLYPFSRDIFDGLPYALKEWYLINTLPRTIAYCDSSPDIIAAFESTVEKSSELSFELLAAWLDLAVAQGSLESLRLLEEITLKKHAEVQGCIALLKGDSERAVSILDTVMPGKKSKGKLGAAAHLPGLFHALSLLSKDIPDALRDAQSIVNAGTKRTGRYGEALQTVGLGIAFKTAPSAVSTFTGRLKACCTSPLTTLIAGFLVKLLLTDEDSSFQVPNLEETAEKLQTFGFDWLSAEALRLAADPTTKVGAKRAERASAIHARLGTGPLVRSAEPEPAWRRALNAAVALASAETPSTAQNIPNERLIWEWNTHDAGFHLNAFHQVRSGSGWSKGRKVALSRLYEEYQEATKLGFLTEQDLALCRALEATTYRHYGYPETIYTFNSDKAARALVGHPGVYPVDDREKPIDIAAQAPSLKVYPDRDGVIAISIDPKPEEDGRAYRMHVESPHRVVMTLYTDTHLKLHRMLGGTMKVPKTGQDAVLESVRKLASLISIHSDLDASHAEGASVEKTAADPTPHIHLTPYQQGLQAEIYVYPFGEEGLFCRPGQGGENIYSDIGGRPRLAVRDLSLELFRSKEILRSCPALFARAENATSMVCPTAEEALDALTELEDLVEAKQTVLHWLKGKSLALAGRASPASLHLHIRKDRDMFAASGSLKVNPKLTLDLVQLFDLVQASPSKFVKLDDGRFLMLTEQLRLRVQELSLFGDRHGKQNKLLFPKVRAAAFEGLAESVALTADDHFKEWVKRIRDMSSLDVDVPSTLTAVLRDYQAEGFQWAARLAALGAGACLADDMGLGKTVVALALLLHRASSGPALVVAPASVTFNWMREAARFAPTLKVRLFGEGDRAEHLSGLGPMDVAVSTYGLLHTEAERLQKISWHTVILDEAQLIKNQAALRSQAAKGLSANFRMIMTGTPIENHLGELWNLFDLINSGLLGSEKQFLERFASPGESDGAAQARRGLKRLIAPFILRRTKSQVQDELPSRTEIVRKVVLGDEEAALYEALRLRAVETLKDAASGKSNLQILAEIMHLRRACCHPRLVLPDSDISSAKLTLFLEIVDELLEGHHKVLVFSQFIDHLKILEDALQRKNVSYQYLDGSTPVKQRKECIDAFQAGKGDVFLISLKAGGLGLNLTAADFVIHMDPWWNPAVEDQASDRAHRLGQKRPVTIYRFIAEGTVEEKIAALHTEKRALADSLLEGADMSGKLSAEELLALIRE